MNFVVLSAFTFGLRLYTEWEKSNEEFLDGGVI